MKYIASILTAALMLCAPLAGAQASRPDGKYSVKAHTGIGLGKAYSASSAIEGVSLEKASDNSVGVDFRYRFWKKEKLSLGLNAGLDYSWGSQSLRASDLDFNYTAGPDADMDGDSYRRFTTIKGLTQDISLADIGIPVYVDFNWQICDRVSIFAQAGIALRFSTTAKIKGDVSGNCSVYGIYPQYDNLKIDEEWLNDFGDSHLYGTPVDKPAQNAFTMSIGAGAGARLWLVGPLSLECGISYDYGLMNRLKAAPFAVGDATAESAPMTYTCASGRQLKALSSALSSDKLSKLRLNIGLIFTF